MNHIKLIPTFQRKKSIPKQLKDLELFPLKEQFSKLTMPIISDDDLRPAMMGNFFDMESKKIVSTDAHKLTAINMPKDTYNFIAQKYNKELNENPKGLIFHTLSQLQKDYNTMVKNQGNNPITISFDEFVKLNEIVDAKYPNYDAVIPKEFTNEIYVDYTKLYWYAKVLLDAKVIDDATKINSSNENEYQNKKIEYLKDSYVPFLNVAKQIILTYTLDGKKEYIGFDARYICDVLKFGIEYKGKTFGKVGLSGNNRAMVIEFENGLYSPSDSIGLIMPVMIMNNDEYTIGEKAYDFNVKMYYDLDTNEINSDGVNYPIDESIGFKANKESLSTPNIRVEKQVSKVENNSASLIDTRIKGLRIALKVAKVENKPKIEKRIKGLEIAKKVQKVDEVQDFYFDTRKDKTFQVISTNGEKMDIQYFDRSKKHTGDILTIDKDEFDYNVSKGAWAKYKQPYFNNGGGVDLGYNYKSVEQIWDNWTTKQKEHFLYDHQDEYPEIRNISKLANLEWNDLKINYVHVLNSLSNHIREGRYNKGGVVFTDYNGSEIMYEPNYDEYFVNDEVFYSMEEAKNYIDSGEMENPKYGFGGGLLVGSLVGGYLGYKVGKYNKQVVSSGFETEKVIGKDIKNKLQGKKTYGGGGGVDTISEEDLLRIKLAVAEAENRIKANNTESDSGSLEGVAKFIKENPQVLAMLEKGGSVGDENYEMLKSKVTELLHHSKELQAILKKKPKASAWVIAKSSRASTDLSDITHYLEGKS